MSHNTMSGSSKTGFFHDAKRGDYVLMWRGEAVDRFPSVAAFVFEHAALLVALEEQQATLLEAAYKPWLGSAPDDAH
ncbi:MAG: hypothetical protein ACO3UV_04865 [Pseudomonadales bacterium]|jgi:hypothetical protein